MTYPSDPLGKMIEEMRTLNDAEYHARADDLLIKCLRYLAPMCHNADLTIQSVEALIKAYEECPKWYD